jgi:putative ABC transport system ATP-binding protein
MALVAVTEITKSYRRGPETIHAVRSVSFELHPGQVCALIGPSGSGKSTVLNIISGWDSPDAGTRAWKGDGSIDPRMLDWTHIGLIPQRLGLLEDLTIAENIELPLVLLGSTPEAVAERSDEILAALDLSGLHDRLPAETSLGEQQRACIARALVSNPELVLADEPTGNQDHVREAKVLARFRAAAAEGAACLLATHNPAVLQRCDRILEMRDGELVSDMQGDPSAAQRADWAPDRGTQR